MLEQTYSSSFEVEQVVDQKLIDGETHFLVKWVGYDHSENTWEPFRHMTHSKDKIKEWQQFKINQLNLASNRKLHEQLNVVTEKNRPKTNSQTFKNISNPYKKVYLRIDEEEQFKLKDSEQGRTKIQTIFDQPEMKKIIKIKKSDRKKKELQLFEKRIKTRPKIWEKYLQNEDQVIKRANQKIKQVIDKAYGGNQKNKDVTYQKDVAMTNNQSQVKKKTKNIYTKQNIQKSSIFNRSNSKIQTDHLKILQPVQKQVQLNKIIEKELVYKQKNQPTKLSTKQFKPMKNQVKEKLNIKVKNIFSSTEEESQQIVENLSKRKKSQTQKSHKTQKNNQIKSKLLIHSDSSIDEETNFISLKDNNINHNKAGDSKNLFAQNRKFQKTLPQIKETVYKGNANNQRKTWVKDLVKGIVLENKKKESIVIRNQLKQQRKIFTIQPQTIMVTQVLRKKLKGEKMDLNQIQFKKSRNIQMSKISEQSEINSYFSRKSSVSNYVHEGMFRLNKPSYVQQKSLQVQTTNGSPQVLIVEQKQKDIVKQCPQGKIQVKQIPIEIQNRLQNNQDLNEQFGKKILIPFQCSISSVDQSVNKNSENNSSIQQLQSIIKPEQTVQNCHKFDDKFDNKSCPQYSSSSSQQQNDQQQSQMIWNRQQSQRVINYSSLTNHMSTTLPQNSNQSLNIHRNNPHQFLNLIRQQSMTTRDSQRIQQPINNIDFNSRSLPIQSIDYQLNPIQNKSQHQQSKISQNSHKSIHHSQQLSFQHKKQNKKQQKTNNNILQQKNCQNLHIPNQKAIHQQEKSFLNKKMQNYEQKCESIKEGKRSPPVQQAIIDYFFFEQKNQQIQLQVFTIDKESNSKKEELKLPSFVKENSNKYLNKSNNSLSNNDKQSLILKYDFSSIN